MNTSIDLVHPDRKTLRHAAVGIARPLILPATFSALEKLGQLSAPFHDGRISRATHGLSVVMAASDFIQAIETTTLRRNHPVARVDDDRNRRCEEAIRAIFIGSHNPLNKQALKGLIDLMTDRLFSYPRPQVFKPREISIPANFVPLLKLIAEKLESNGAPGFFACRGKTSLGKVIDWMVQTEAFQRVLRNATETKRRDLASSNAV